MVKYVDSSKTNDSGADNFENEKLRVLELSAFTLKNWHSLLSTNAECSDEMYNVLDEGDRNINFNFMVEDVIPKSKFSK